ncbi:hypothetical protein BH23CHL7_BH23CHL7_06400 [soil metagenome]
MTLDSLRRRRLDIALDWTKLAAIGALVLALVIGPVAAMQPALATLGVLAGAGLAAVVMLWDRLPRVFLVFLTTILFLYAIGGRGMAYLGASPVFVGEIALGLGVLAILSRISRVRVTAIHVALLAFMAWGALQTVPYIGVYGIDALRDAVTWGYAIFAVIVAATVLPQHFQKIVQLYGRVLPWFLPWIPVAMLVNMQLYDVLPRAPGAPVPLIVFKGGDMGVHLAGIAAFLLVGLYWRIRPRLPDLWVWATWLLALGSAASINRGGMLAASTAGIALLFNRSFSRFAKPVVAAVLILAVLLTIDPQIDLGRSRVLSMSQLMENVASIVGDDEVSHGLSATVEWRQRWWNTIIDYTVHGRYFWFGKGFGINLALDDGFQTAQTETLRSPHNGHLEILARMGVPGLLLWAAFIIAFLASVVRAAIAAYRRGNVWWTGILAWLLTYWVAALVNASFDVYLQGPQGGIWFWTITGLAVVAIRASKETDSGRPDSDLQRQDFGLTSRPRSM